ncbi:MAG: hypothetical protein COB69_02650 [Phycisphaera sp.]|nr:MAG: hypothetical protein COB69_02650 [Phycisphaera sp.]
MTKHKVHPDDAFAAKPPILLVGSQRSGTTFLGKMLSMAEDVAYWIEPRHVWTRGNAYRPDQRLTAEHVTPRIRMRIRQAFADYAGTKRFCEKTPSNCLRLLFIHEVIPEARILLILRDGRSVMRSTGEIMNEGVAVSRVLERARQTPLTEWPAFFGQAISTLTRRVTNRPLKYWGMKPPGWKAWAKLPRDEMLAHQWAAGMTIALDDAEAIGPDNIMMFRYEDLVLDPESVGKQIATFTGLGEDSSFVTHIIKESNPSSIHKWRDDLDRDTLDTLRPILEPTLTRMGYQW